MEDNKLNESLERVIASLTEEQKEKVAACKDMNELTALLGELGVELPDELLDDVGGGFNLGAFFNRPLFIPIFGGAIKLPTSEEGVDAIHMDLKGGSSPDIVHTDVSAGTKGQGKTRYV